jgi:hypothetical protein
MGCKLVVKDLFVNMVLEKNTIKKRKFMPIFSFWANFHCGDKRNLKKFEVFFSKV